MFTLLSAVTASLMALPVPQPGSLKPSFTAAMNEGGSAALEVRVVVSPAGVPIHCDAAFVNGPHTNVDAFCSMLQSSTRFAPAQNPLGEPTYGLIHIWSEWKKGKWIGSQVPEWNPPEVIITTNRMPNGFGEDSTLQFVLNTDSAGKVSACIGPAGLPQQALDVLCHAAAQAASPIIDENGKPVSGVEELRARVMSQPAVDRLKKWLKRFQ